MKKILIFMIALVIILLLILFSIWQKQEQADDPYLSLPQDSFDALVLVDQNQQTKSDLYDLKKIQKEALSSQYQPLVSTESTAISYQKNLTVKIARTLDVSENDLCHYGLFEKQGKQFAVFYAEISKQENAERLCHLLLCYRDYFPVLLFGNFNKTAQELLTNVCNLSSQTLNGTTYFYENLSVTPHEKSGTLLLHFKETPRSLDLNKKMVALTFDDGPSDYTSEILETLANHSAKATFFVNGTHVTDYPQTIQNIFSNGCEIGNHTNLHELFSHNTQAIIRKTVEETNKKVRSVIGIGTFVVRPPGGETLDRYQKPVSVGYPIVRWSLDTLDYTDNQTVESLMQRIRTVKHGDIILMHDTKKVTLQATDSIVSYLLEQNYQLVTVSELLEFAADGAERDSIYNDISSVK